MTRLQTLQLGSNILKSLPETIGGCHSLEHLELADNELTKLPEYICKLENLKVVVVDNNSIEELPKKMFTECKHLHTLSIRSNPIEMDQLHRKYGEMIKITS